MGCLSSKAAISKNGKSAYGLYKSSNLSQQEIELRTEAPQFSKEFHHSRVNIKYAWASQRGYYPDSLDKENQDSYSILPSIVTKVHSQTDVALFGVYDGHGTDGHLASRYVRNEVLIKLLIISGLDSTCNLLLPIHTIPAAYESDCNA
jgi:hypothetical protein